MWVKEEKRKRKGGRDTRSGRVGEKDDEDGPCNLGRMDEGSYTCFLFPLCPPCHPSGCPIVMSTGLRPAFRARGAEKIRSVHAMLQLLVDDHRKRTHASPRGAHTNVAHGVTAAVVQPV